MRAGVWFIGLWLLLRGGRFMHLLQSCSRFALIAGGTPAVPVNHLLLMIVPRCFDTLRNFHQTIHVVFFAAFSLDLDRRVRDAEVVF
jgi:hypothetical protein